MKRIGEFKQGGILVVMSETEWQQVCRAIDQAIVKDEKLQQRKEWAKAFEARLNSLHLPSGLRGLIVRQLIYSRHRQSFQASPEGGLVSFDGWCQMILRPPPHFKLYNIGPKRMAVLRQAVVDHWLPTQTPMRIELEQN